MRLNIKTLDEQMICSLLPLPGDNWWPSVQDAIAQEFRCDQDDITTMEVENDDELICIDGQPVARLIRKWGWESC